MRRKLVIYINITYFIKRFEVHIKSVAKIKAHVTLTHNHTALMQN